MSANRRVCLGAFAGAHGVRGEAKVKTFTASEDGVGAYGPVESEDGARRFTLKFLRALKPGLALVSAPEIESREDAERLAGTRLYVARAALPAPEDEDEFYMDDLVGLKAVDETGAEIGRVAAAYNFGASDLLEIRRPDTAKGAAAALIVPFTKDAVPQIDLAAGRLAVARFILDAAATPGEAEPPQDAPDPTLSDETGELVCTDLEANLDAMREEDA